MKSNIVMHEHVFSGATCTLTCRKCLFKQGQFQVAHSKCVSTTGFMAVIQLSGGGGGQLSVRSFVVSGVFTGRW